ncbi:Dehydrogenase (flavoprotein) [Haladaptatus litoreus]|uniref:Dehydrogenase (Flavoprotein) n=1 Tax=Haladaptatus litoreus TaxID=553468 RepID=A0A1N6WE75_9EURY|nr:FAD-dependent monooxygenase [Haladaptatus litoreus]SIQ88332.1 Dehydrogenase (flavoprotein) [Haladaptatus litoreus]
MTLASVSRYDSNRLSKRGGNAVVIGAGMAGLFVARVLADTFDSVTVIDRDSLVDEPIARRGVPQGQQPHALLEAGKVTLEDFFPGFGDDIVSSGGVVVDFASDVNFYTEGDFLADGPTRKETFSATRPLFERLVRRRVSDFDRVSIRSNCQFTDYLSNADATTVEGVVFRKDGEEKELPADLVVDATGRTSRTPAWLAEHGYTPPEVEEAHIDLAYSTAFIERPPDDLRTFLVPPSAPRTRGGMAAPVEGDRWIVNMNGVHGDTPPTEFADFSAFAESLPTPEVKRLLDTHPPVSETVERYPFPSNRRHRYEALDRFPDGLLVVGDAIASYNPVYAQGMSVAALEAVLLHQTLATDGREDLALRFFERAGPVIDVAWMLAVGSDFGFPQTTGSKPRGTAVMGRYLSRLTRKAHADSTLSDAFSRVLMMEDPPTSLFRPRIVWRVLKPTG